MKPDRGEESEILFDSGPLDDEETARAADEILGRLDSEEGERKS
jgi:hypothetical protein